MRLRFIFATLAICLPGLAHAYTSTLETGEVVQPDKYRAILEPQFIFNRDSGVNLVGKFDTGLTESSSIRALVGFGEIDFQIGAMYKLIPFPDTESQPAIGFTTGFIYAQTQDETEINLRFHPLVSKKFETEIGDLLPYVSVPFGIRFRDSKTEVPFQFAGGTEWKTLHFENVTFMAELGVNLHRSYSYLSLAGVYSW